MFQNEIIREILKNRQERIELDLKVARAEFDQTTDIGTEFEVSIREVLHKHLPSWTSVGHGEVIDSKGSRSAQTDIIVTNQDQPFRTHSDRAGLFIIEGVAAAGEVKANLTSDGMTDAIEKAKKFKQLESFLPFRTQFSAHKSDVERYYKHPPWFLVASESQITLKKAGEMVRENIGGNGWEVNRTLDAVFVLNRGVLINTGDGKGVLHGVRPDGSSSEGWIIDESCEFTLSAMIAWLSMSMLKMWIPNSLLNAYCQRPGTDSPG